MNREQYFEELGIALRREGFSVLPEQGGLLPVEWDIKQQHSLLSLYRTKTIFYEQALLQSLQCVPMKWYPAFLYPQSDLQSGQVWDCRHQKTAAV